MNELEERLTHHLHDTAKAAEPEPDLHAVLHETGTQHPDHHRPRGRFWLSAAAAVFVVGGAVGLVMLADSRSPTTADQPATTSPPTAPTISSVVETVTGPEQLEAPAHSSGDPTSFPVLDDVPEGLSVTTYVQRIGEGASTPMTEALVGRRVDGVLTDAVHVTVQSEPVDPSPMQGRTPTETVVMGQPALVFDYSNSGRPPHFLVVWGSGPYFVAEGEAPMALLELATPGAIDASVPANAGDPPQLSFATLPDGFEVVAPPRPFGDRATLNAVLSIGADNYDVSVSTRNPLALMALGRPLRSIEVNGQPAWTFLSWAGTQDITWQVDDATYVYLKINDGTDAAGALALANQLTFVDFETWTARYSPDISVTGTTEP